MRCEVRLVDETALPEAQSWVIGMTHRGERFLFVKREAFSPAVLEQAWEAGLELNGIPAQRSGSSCLVWRDEAGRPHVHHSRVVAV